jgi:integrase
MGKLTALEIKNATKPRSYVDGDGLMLVVKSGGARSWVLRTLIDGKRRDIGIGPAKDVSLAKARIKAGELRTMIRDGIDPIEDRRAKKRAAAEIPTFEKAAELCHAEHKSGWRNVKHRQDWLSSLRLYAFPSLGALRVDKIDAPMVRDVLMPIWLAKPETARRVRQRIRSVMGWAASQGHRPPLDLNVMDAGLPRQPRRDGHFEAMAYDDVPAFVAKVQSAPETVGRLALLFTIATAARSGEVRGVTWPEIDLQAATWTIPTRPRAPSHPQRAAGGRQWKPKRR